MWVRFFMVIFMVMHACMTFGCATRYLYDDHLQQRDMHSHILVFGQQSVLVSRGVCYLTHADSAYTLDCTLEEFKRANTMLIWLEEVSRFPTRYQLNDGDRYLQSGKIDPSQMPLLYSWETIDAQVVSVTFAGIKPKSIYFKMAMTPFAIAMDASLVGGLIMGSVALNPATAATLIQASAQ